MLLAREKMGENHNLIQIKMERAEEGPSTSTRPVPPPPLPSPSSSSANTLKASDLSDGTKKTFTMALHSKITNLEKQLAVEKNKYAEFTNFAYQSSRELIEMLGDMKTCLDVATRGGKEGEEMAQFPVILNSLKENLGDMEERDRQAIRKQLGDLWGVIRRIKLKLTAVAAPKARKPEKKTLDRNDTELIR